MYFRPLDPTGEVRAERARWLNTASGQHLWAPPASAPLIEELIRSLERWGALLPGSVPTGHPPAERLDHVGRQLEPDILLLQREGPDRADPIHRLAAGCVCFPSSWSLASKHGLTLDETHAIVPGLNPDLGRSINRFLTRLTPDEAWCRTNWGLSTSSELNQDPWRQLPRLARGADPSRLWLRVEHQALVALPGSNGVLFAIRIESIPLTTVAAIAVARDGLRHALQAMPPALADYKGITPVREDLLGWLQR